MKISALFGHHIARGSGWGVGGGGDDGMNPKPNNKWSLGPESYGTIAWKGLSHSPKFFCPPLYIFVQFVFNKSLSNLAILPL